MKRKRSRSEDEIREEYDFSKGARGKHANRYAEGTNIVLLAPDVYKVFTNSDEVNTALRSLIQIAERVPKQAKNKVAKSA